MVALAVAAVFGLIGGLMVAAMGGSALVAFPTGGATFGAAFGIAMIAIKFIYDKP